MRFLIHSWAGQIILPLLVFMMLYLIKFALGKKIKIRLADFLLPFLFVFDSFALRECFWDFNFAVRYFCFFSIWFFEDSHHGFL